MKIDTKSFAEKAANLLQFNDKDIDYLTWQGDRLMIQVGSGVTAYTDVENIGDEPVILPQKAIELIKKINTETCDIEIDGGQIVIKYNKSRAKFNMAEKLYAAEIYDGDIPKMNNIPNRLLPTIKKVNKICASQETSNKAATGLYFNGNGKTLEVVATDGYRIVIYTVKNCKTRMQMLIPKQLVEKILSLAAGKKCDIEVCAVSTEYSGEKAMFKVGEYIIITPMLVFEKYIDYKTLQKNSEKGQVVAVNPYEMREAIERAQICAERNSPIVICASAEDKQLQIMAKSQNKRIVEEIPSNFVENDVERGFNPIWLNEILSFYDTDVDMVFGSGTTTPMYILDDNDNQSLYCLLLPMRYKKEEFAK